MESISIQSRGVYLTTPENLDSKETDISLPQPHEVQIIPRSTTLCGSDLHYYHHGRNGSIKVREPLCLGHESAGEVVSIGTEVKGVKIGDKVAIECGVPCSNCDVCLDGRYNLCSKMRFRSSGSAFPHFQGTLQERINHPAEWVHRLPEILSYDDGALLEPLAVACHAARRAQVGSNSSCLVIGAGPVGLLCAAVARFHGCINIAISDIDSKRVEFALEHGYADVSYIVGRRSASSVDEQMANARSVADEIGDQHWANGSRIGKFSITFECTGMPSCVQTSIFATKSGGRVMLVGMGTPNHTLPLSEVAAREIDLMPTWRYANCYEEAIQLMQLAARGEFKPDIRQLITHRFAGLDKVGEAFELASSPVDSKGNMVIKVAVNNTK